MKGRVKWFSTNKGFGFILGDDKKDYFVHFKQIMCEGFKTLDEGDNVIFEAGKSDKGLVALNVKPD